MDKYTELYAWMWSSFREDEFTIDQFRMIFPTSQAPKVMHDLDKKGYIFRVGRGTYKMTKPDEFIRKIAEEEPDDRILENAGKDYAFCESTAATIWTDGYYWTGFTKGFKPVHVAVKTKDLNSWKAFFKKNRVRFALEGESRTLYGKVYVLHPMKLVQSVEKEGIKVVPLEEVVDFCLQREIVYEPALEYLDEKYDINYTTREALET